MCGEILFVLEGLPRYVGQEASPCFCHMPMKRSRSKEARLA